VSRYPERDLQDRLYGAMEAIEDDLAHNQDSDEYWLECFINGLLEEYDLDKSWTNVLQKCALMATRSRRSRVSPLPENYCVMDVDEVRSFIREMDAAYAELRKVRKHVGAVYDRAVWDRAEEHALKQMRLISIIAKIKEI